MAQANEKYDLTGRLFGMLTAIERVDGHNTRSRWRCRCLCGQEKIVSYHDLAYGKTRSCGCVRAAKAAKDLTGRRFGRLVAQERLPEKKDGSYVWRCQCDCGGVAFFTAAALDRGAVRSCGCLSVEAKRAKAIDLAGKHFGRLTAVEPTEKRDGSGNVIWRCKCDCGKESFQPASLLKQGRVTSCGCKRKENDVLKNKLDYVDNTCVQFISNTGKLRKDNTSGVRGVSLHNGKWRARISFRKKVYYLGEYRDMEDAVRVRKKAESTLYGEFLDWYNENFPQKQETEQEVTPS